MAPSLKFGLFYYSLTGSCTQNVPYQADVFCLEWGGRKKRNLESSTHALYHSLFPPPHACAWKNGGRTYMRESSSCLGD